MTPLSWGFWAALLIAQNFAFTFVSRARNSASLKRHMVAAIFSNAIFFCAQIFAVNTIMSLLTGKQGIWKAMFAVLFYTTFTLVGSLVAHKWALRNESGLHAVGANKKYAQITVEEWEKVREYGTTSGRG